MNTPYKNSTNLQDNSNQMNQFTVNQYPSTQSGFIPFNESTPKNRNKSQIEQNPQHSHSGGNWSQNRNNRNFRQNDYRNNSQFSPGNGFDNKEREKYFNKPYQSGGNKNRYNSYQQNNRRNFYQQNNRKGNSSGFGYNTGQNNQDVKITDYIHSSMLEDPWKDLLERHNALDSGNLQIFSQNDSIKELEKSPADSHNSSADLIEAENSSDKNSND